MKHLIIVLMLTGCMPAVKYTKDQTLTQADMDESACETIAQNARNQYFPHNPFLNAEARQKSMASCMESKGYKSEY